MVTYDRRTGKEVPKGRTLDYSGVKDPSILQYSETTGQKITQGANYDAISADALGSATPLKINANAGKTDSSTSSGLEYINSTTQQGISDAEAKLTALKTSKDTARGEVEDVITELGKQGLKEEKYLKELGADEAKRQYDDFSSQLEAEQVALRRKMDKLRETNPTGALTIGLQSQLDDIERKSLSKQADIAILGNAQLRKWETASAIASRKVQAETEYLKASLEAKKLVYEDNRAEFTTAEQRVIDAKIRQEERQYNLAVAEKTGIENIKLEFLKNGGSISAVQGKDFKTVDEALKTLGSGLATSQADFITVGEGANKQVLRVDKRTGRVLDTYGGSSSPKVVQREVNGKPVTGYTLEAGDDPYFIAQMNGTDMAGLKAVNPNIKDWNNIPVGATINVPLSDDDSFVQKMLSTDGGKSLTDTSIQKLDKGLTVLAQLGVLQENIKDTKTSPLVGYFREKNPWDNKAQVIKAQLNAIVPNLARGVYGEVGVLTDNDIAQYSKTIPNMKSEEEVRNAILYITLDMIGKSIKNTLNVNASAGRDVSGFVDIYTEMQNSKKSILSTIPSANVNIPSSIRQDGGVDTFLQQFSPSAIESSITNSDFFNQFEL